MDKVEGVINGVKYSFIRDSNGLSLKTLNTSKSIVTILFKKEIHHESLGKAIVQDKVDCYPATNSTPAISKMINLTDHCDIENIVVNIAYKLVSL